MNKRTRRFNDTYAAPGSALAQALDVGKKQAQAVYDETSQRYEKQFSAGDRAWFAARHNQGAIK